MGTGQEIAMLKRNLGTLICGTLFVVALAITTTLAGVPAWSVTLSCVLAGGSFAACLK
jgi:hypothetical protein